MAEAPNLEPTVVRIAMMSPRGCPCAPDIALPNLKKEYNNNTRTAEYFETEVLPKIRTTEEKPTQDEKQAIQKIINDGKELQSRIIDHLLQKK